MTVPSTRWRMYTDHRGTPWRVRPRSFENAHVGSCVEWEFARLVPDPIFLTWQVTHFLPVHEHLGDLLDGLLAGEREQEELVGHWSGQGRTYTATLIRTRQGVRIQARKCNRKVNVILPTSILELFINDLRAHEDPTVGRWPELIPRMGRTTQVASTGLMGQVWSPRKRALATSAG